MLVGMKVLYISHDAHLYGAPKSLLEFVYSIKGKGVEPVIIMPDRGNLKSELDKNGIKNRIIPFCNCICQNSYGLSDYVRYISTNYKAVLKIIKIIQDEQIDIVHTNSLVVNVGAMAAYVLGVPHIWHLREYLEEDFDYKMLNGRWNRRLMKCSGCCIAISKGIRKKYKRKYSADIVCIYNGMKSSSYYSPLPVYKEPAIDGIGELLIAGTVCEGKGQWDAVHAVETLVNRRVAVHLNIVGDGKPVFVNRLKQYVREKGLAEYIAFYPYMTNLQELRLRSKIILVCSRMEAFGRVTAEAMMAGKIVIGTDSGGTLELIGEKEERGYLYPYGYPDELADKIQCALRNPEEVYEKEKRAQKFIMTLTDMERYTERLLKIYRKVSGQQAGGHAYQHV